MHVVDPSRAIDTGIAGALSAGSLGMGLLGALSQIPGGTGVAVAGIVGSVVIQIGRMWFDDRTRALAQQNDHLRQEQAAASDREQRYIARIFTLESQVEYKESRNERLIGVLMAHAPDVPEVVARHAAEAMAPDAGKA